MTFKFCVFIHTIVFQWVVAWLKTCFQTYTNTCFNMKYLTKFRKINGPCFFRSVWNVWNGMKSWPCFTYFNMKFLNKFRKIKRPCFFRSVWNIWNGLKSCSSWNKIIIPKMQMNRNEKYRMFCFVRQYTITNEFKHTMIFACVCIITWDGVKHSRYL